MTRSLEHCLTTRQTRPFGALALAAALSTLALSAACGDDDDSNGGGGGTSAAGSAGTGGTGGSAGAGGSAGSSMAGSSGAGGGAPSDATGSVEVLSGDASRLLGPTTAALRGQNVWVANGQLGGLFGGAAPQLPFTAVSVPLAGGDIGAAVIELDGDTFYPEGIAAAEDGTLYIGSVATGTIVRVPANSTTAEPFLAAGVATAGVIGLKVDEDRDLLWFCDSDPTDMPRTGAVVGVSLDDAAEVVRHDLTAPDAPSLFCNDLLVDPEGNLWVTESLAGIIYRINAADVMTENSAEIWMRGGLAAPPAGGFGPNGLALAGDTLIVANVGNGALFAVDPASDDPASDARAITLSEGTTAGATLCGPDGLVSVPGSDDEIVVVENGGCTAATPRVVRVTLDLD